jgi:hypothetical protein
VILLASILVLRSSSACTRPTAGPGEHCDWDVAFGCEETQCTDGYVCSDTANTCVRDDEPPPYEPSYSPPDSDASSSADAGAAPGPDAASDAEVDANATEGGEGDAGAEDGGDAATSGCHGQ